MFWLRKRACKYFFEAIENFIIFDLHSKIDLLIRTSSCEIKDQVNRNVKHICSESIRLSGEQIEGVFNWITVEASVQSLRSTGYVDVNQNKL